MPVEDVRGYVGIDDDLRGAPPELAAALGDALVTMTAVQLNVLGAQNADPNAISIPLWGVA